jgi:hypothetical protein
MLVGTNRPIATNAFSAAPETADFEAVPVQLTR